MRLLLWTQPLVSLNQGYILCFFGFLYYIYKSIGKDVYGEKRIQVDGPPGVDGNPLKLEYRVWNPFRSKLAAAILGGEFVRSRFMKQQGVVSSFNNNLLFTFNFASWLFPYYDNFFLWPRYLSSHFPIVKFFIFWNIFRWTCRLQTLMTVYQVLPLRMSISPIFDRTLIGPFDYFFLCKHFFRLSRFLPDLHVPTPRPSLPALLLTGVDHIHISPGTKVLYIGASAGTTVSHVSDIVGPTGCVYAVEFAHR